MEDAPSNTYSDTVTVEYVTAAVGKGALTYPEILTCSLISI
jgi:hypothetical protein